MAAVGAPSKYDPSYCERVIELGKTGASKAKMASMLGVHRDSLHEWARVHPEFSDALSRATQEAQVWWEDVGQSNLTNKSFQAGAWGKNMSCRFKDDWTENTKQQIEHTGKDGGPIEARILSDETQRMLSELQESAGKKAPSSDASED